MTGIPIGKPREYHMSFNIENGGKAITGVKVTLCRFIEKDMNAKFSLDLVCDPVFPALLQNILANSRNNADLAFVLSALNDARDYITTNPDLANRLSDAIALFGNATK